AEKPYLASTPVHVRVLHSCPTRRSSDLQESGQTAQFIVTNNTNSGLFSSAPGISASGTLTYTPAPDANGSATITVVLKDNGGTRDRKSTRLNSSHGSISYAVFCLKKKPE